ncbi:hypothetical protein NMD70_09845 [Edwardsiella tarda]|uniref:hypothetical protein n=1 Tax=Edwardsiella tarda TaxID=636 RepID=UPI00351CA02A
MTVKVTIAFNKLPQGLDISCNVSAEAGEVHKCEVESAVILANQIGSVMQTIFGTPKTKNCSSDAEVQQFIKTLFGEVSKPKVH